MARKNQKPAAKKTRKTGTLPEGKQHADPTKANNRPKKAPRVRGGEKPQSGTQQLQPVPVQGTLPKGMTPPSSLAVAAAPPAALPEKPATNRRKAIHDKEGKGLGVKPDPRDESEKAFDAADQASQLEEGLPVHTCTTPIKRTSRDRKVVEKIMGGLTAEEARAEVRREEQENPLSGGQGRPNGMPSDSASTNPVNPPTSQDAEGNASALTAKPPAPSVSRLSKALQAAAKPNGMVGGRQPTEEQRAILDAALAMNSRGVLVIEAGAGTGKTTTDVMLENVLPGNGQYTAFNSSLVKESKTKFKRAGCNTYHSLAFRAEGKRYAHRLEGKRMRSEQIAQILGIEDITLMIEGVKVKCPDCNEKGQQPNGVACAHCQNGYKIGKPSKRILSAGFLAGQVTGALRRFCQSADAEITGGHFRYIDGIDMPKDGNRVYANNEKVRDYLVPFAHKMWADAVDVEGQLPFSHDYYVKIWQLGKPVIAADYILVDESQDLPACFLDILQQQESLVILVGDSAQQIYEWRGAVNAMAAFPEAPRLFLSQSFRFGEAIASVANQILGCLQEPTPLRLKGLPSIPSRIEAVAQPRAILCRTNAAAIQHMLLALGEGRRPFLVGGGSDVIAFVEGAKALQEGRSTSHPDLACFGSWLEVEQYSQMEEGEELRLMVKLVNQFGADTIVTALRQMPEEQAADLVISTAHKSKGREWYTVKLASDFPTRSKSSDPDLRLLYVAATRAKLVLDISECPFFTGQDALPLEIVYAKPERPTEGLLPSAPAIAPKPTEFTWSKGRQGDWLIRGPAGAKGEVEVTRKDGSKAKKTLGSVVWEDGKVALYKPC